MSTKRPPNELESKLHQAALLAPKNELSSTQAEEIIPNSNARQKALNFLLAVGLFKPLTDKKGRVFFRAVDRSELDATKDLNAEEKLVLNHIKLSDNEGIWTKHLKAKTNLHQTIIDRCLKTLTQKHLIKRVPSVQYPTRKLYMMEGIEPSIALTGGPWYTDNELDTEFIETLIKACFKFIRDLSFPKRREGTLFPISNSPQYPTAQQVRNTLRQARLTETDLSVEHVEMLLNVLVLDGEIEKIPAFGSALWDPGALDDDESEDEYPKKSHKKKRKRHESDSEDEDRKQKKKRNKRAASSSDSDSDNSLKSKQKRSRHDSNSDAEPSSSKKKKKYSKSSSDEPDSNDDKIEKRSSSPAVDYSFDEGGGFVYRAVKQERLTLGWSQAPCSRCQSFEFCKDGGPVNAAECIYYGDWLIGGTVEEMEDM